MARILVVDDENNIRMMVRLTLEQAGHEIETAADGESGLRLFGDGTGFDLVLLDQRMPGMEGLEVLREMKSRNPESRIVMITAFGTIDLAVDAMKAGATDFLRKPFTTEILRGAVLGALMTKPKPAPPVIEEPVGEVAVEEEGISINLEVAPLIYGLTTVNGYHIESDPKAVVAEDGDLLYAFEVRSPDGKLESCTVRLAENAIAEVKKIARKELGNRFWHAVCEHELSNYLYQNAAYPPDLFLPIDAVDRGLSKWVKAAA